MRGSLLHTIVFSKSTRVRPHPWRKHRRSCEHRTSDSSGLARQALNSAAPRRIQAGDLVDEVAQRQVSVLSDQAVNLSARPRRQVLLAAQARSVEVGLAVVPLREGIYDSA